MTKMSAEYRNRLKAIEAGTWNPHKAAEPTLVPTPLDWAWAAGFLDGEGSFVATATTARITAPQKERELLDRLLALFGGSVNYQVKGRQTPIFYWSVCGAKARAVAQGVYPMLSSRRREQVDRMLAERGGA